MKKLTTEEKYWVNIIYYMYYIVYLFIIFYMLGIDVNRGWTWVGLANPSVSQDHLKWNMN